MKIKVLCSDNQRFSQIQHVVCEIDPEADISGGVWRIEDLPTFIDGAALDLLILDPSSEASLPTIEVLTQRRPDVDVLMVSPDTSAEFLMRAMRSGVREVLPGPASDDALQEALGRFLLKRNQLSGMRGDGKVISFISCKGGAGATFVAANLAYALSVTGGRRVALIDLNLQFGDAVMFVSDHLPPSNVAEVAREIRRLDASFLRAAMLEVSPEMHVLAAPEDPAMGADVKREHVESIVRLARRNYDFVIIDVARTLDAVSLQALDMSDLVCPVSQLTLPFVRDSKRLSELFRSLGYPAERIRMIVNRYSKGGEISLEDIERTVGQKVAWTVPNSYVAAASSVNLGIPMLKGQPADPISRALLGMAHELMPERKAHAAGGGGWLSRLLGNPSA